MSRLKRQRLTEAGDERAAAWSNEKGPREDAEVRQYPQGRQTLQGSRRSLFVRSLPDSATTESLVDFFSESYPLKHATVVVDKATKQSRGFGFVTFADVQDAEQAQEHFDGALFAGSKIKVEGAEPRNRQQNQEPASSLPNNKHRPQLSQLPSKLIVRNLPWTVRNEDQLSKLFMSYGKIKYTNLPKKGTGLSAGFGFVILRGRRNAERALEGMNGREIDGRIIAVDWAVEKSVWETREQAGEKPDDLDQADECVKLEQDKGDDLSDDDISAVPSSIHSLESGSISGNGHDSEVEEHKKDKIKSINPTGSACKGPTLFVRNIPFTVTEASLLEHFAAFGPIRYARIVVDQVTERSRGTGFVCFFNAEDADTCLRDAPRLPSFSSPQRPTGKSNGTSPVKQSVLEDMSRDRTGRYTLEARVLQISRAVDRTEAVRLRFTNTELRDTRDRDRRRLYLLSEGNVPSSSPLYQKISPSEAKMREDSVKQRQTLMNRNPALQLSLTRLSIRNLPRTITSKQLKSFARAAVVGFAIDVKNGSRTQISKEELSRGGEAMRIAEWNRKAKGKGIVKQAKVIFEGRDGGKVAEDSGAGRSRGYGFIEYSSHRWALMGLRWLNGHSVDPTRIAKEATAVAAVGGRTKRLIVEFAIENAQVVSRRGEREEKARQRSKLVSKQREEARPLHKKKQWTKDQLMAKTRKGTKRERPSEEDSEGASTNLSRAQGPYEAEKAAKRQRIIGRKRMSRREKQRGRRT